MSEKETFVDPNPGVADNLGILHQGETLQRIMGIEPPPIPPLSLPSYVSIRSLDQRPLNRRPGFYTRGKKWIIDCRYFK